MIFDVSRSLPNGRESAVEICVMCLLVCDVLFAVVQFSTWWSCALPSCW